MIELARSDALKGLKRFSRLAEHAVLVSQYAPDPVYWQVQANARRSIYHWLIDIIKTQGVDQAYLFAQQRYADLPFIDVDPNISGQRSALESFFTIVGGNPSNLEGEILPNAQIEA